jgi:hypothetical protein
MTRKTGGPSRESGCPWPWVRVGGSGVGFFGRLVHRDTRPHLRLASEALARMPDSEVDAMYAEEQRRRKGKKTTPVRRVG